MGYSDTIKSDTEKFRRPGGGLLSGCPERNQRGTKARLKLCVGGRYILRHSLISVGAAHWAARRGGRLRSHPHLSRFACHLPPAGGRLSGGSWTRPYGGYGSDRVILIGAGLGPARGRTLCAPTTGNGPATRIVPLIRLAYGQPPSPKGEGYGRPQGSPLR